MTELAHFTIAELPGSVAVWVAGLGLGILLGSRQGRAGVAALASSLSGTIRRR